VKRVAALDGVRGIAIAAVVGLHAFNWPSNGGRGVDIFFVLSGFLITSLLMNEQAASGSVSFRSFYGRRARRLVPALLLVVAAYVAVSVATAHRVGHPALAGLIAASFTTNLFASSGHQSLAGALGPTWSLSAEEQFYLIWPAVLLLALRGRRPAAIRVLVLAIVAVTIEQELLAATGASSWRLTFAPDTRSVGLAVGCLAALCVPELGRLRRGAGSLAVALSLGFVGLGLSFQSVAPYRRGGLTVFCAAVAVLVVYAAHGSSVATRALSFAPLVGLGRISYSLYLYHLPILLGFGAISSGSVSRKILAIELSVLAAALSFRYIEQPILRRGGRSSPHPPRTTEARPFALEPAVAER
jgi:peptidoglycan/LPS O-acetylase OafA/YrhL